MGVTIPGYHLASPRDLKELRYKLKGGGRSRKLAEDLTLTSLIDMFAVIVFFLINTFSTSGDASFINSDIKLPAAEHAMELKRAPIVTVMQDKVTLEGGEQNADSNGGIIDKIEETDWELPKLQSKLLEYKKFFESIHTDVKYPPVVIIQAAKDLDFLYVKRVLFTLTKMGFSDINLAVEGKATIISKDEGK